MYSKYEAFIILCLLTKKSNIARSDKTRNLLHYRGYMLIKTAVGTRLHGLLPHDDENGNWGKYFVLLCQENHNNINN